MDKKLTTSKIMQMKNNKKIVMITAYDALFAKIFNDIVDILLVGDSLNMSFNAEPDTLSLDINAMLYHTKAVSKVANKTLVIADMPFGTCYDEKSTLKNAIKLIKQGGADSVKIEGGLRVAPLVKRLCDEGISVCGHIGLMPQQVRFEGGYKIKGKSIDDEKRLLDEALALQEAGAFAVVLEGVVSQVAKKISQSITIPTIGIGSGCDTDGQVLVWSDMLGFFDEFKPKFVKRYLDGAKIVKDAVQKYTNEVREIKFPSEEFEYRA
ncbi:3-methyl-2-oxobutanoate hydroxymethyltransferase [Campylobacter majalis]|uniref:3-methyl-2-oxobutanoate hydroxymethyltransferase n=1 Tax=Campylobacter majalis TaxID=2790656 RepID=UPI003D69CA35